MEVLGLYKYKESDWYVLVLIPEERPLICHPQTTKLKMGINHTVYSARGLRKHFNELLV